MEWISVKDKMPEMMETIIFWDKSNEKVMTGMALLDGVHCNGHRHPCSHWMTLPDPPDINA